MKTQSGPIRGSRSKGRKGACSWQQSAPKTAAPKTAPVWKPLRASEPRFRKVVDSATGWVWIFYTHRLFE